MRIGDTLKLYTFESENDEGRAFEATIMITESGTVTLKERGKEPVRWTTQHVVESMMYRRMIDETVLQIA